MCVICVCVGGGQRRSEPAPWLLLLCAISGDRPHPTRALAVRRLRILNVEWEALPRDSDHLRE